MIIPLAISAAAVTATLLYASWRDVRERRVPFRTWYPMLAAGLPASAFFYITLASAGDWQLVAALLALTALCASAFYLFAVLHLFGGADAWALIFLAACIPLFPIEPWTGYPPTVFFPFSVLVNALILNLLAPAGIFMFNLWKGNRAPIPYLFMGFPVEGSAIRDSFGFVMEEITEDEGVISRRFIGIRNSLAATLRGERKRYTKELRDHPEEYKSELNLYSRAGKIWISWGVPFMVPIPGGMLTALFSGDILYSILRSI